MQKRVGSAQPSLWSEEQRREMIEMFNQKQSMGRIAEHFNTTRSAIAGLIKRMRDKPLPGMVIREVDPNYVKPLVHRWGNRVLAPKPQPKPQTVVIVPLPEVHKRIRMRLVQDQEVCLLDLKEHHCRYPLGDPRRPDFRFCGQNKIATGPYCQEHAQVAFREPEIRRRHK